MAGENGEVDAPGYDAGAEGVRPSGTEEKVFVAVGGVDVDALHGFRLIVGRLVVK